MGLLGSKNQKTPDRSRDITVALRAMNNTNNEIEDAMQEIVADQYGKRKARYEHEDIVMANEYILMIKHIDDTIEMLRQRLNATIVEADSLKVILQERVELLTKRVDHEKTVIEAYKNEFTGIHARVTEVIDDKGNSNTDNDNVSGNGWGSKKPQDGKSSSGDKNNNQ